MRRPMLGVLAASIMMVNMPSTTLSQSRPRTIVALLAHADDEAAAGSVLVRYAREGVDVHLITASDGSAGSGSSGGHLIGADSTPKGDSLAVQRAQEARCAAALGAKEPVLLGFPDGKLGDYRPIRPCPWLPRIAIHGRDAAADAAGDVMRPEWQGRLHPGLSGDERRRPVSLGIRPPLAHPVSRSPR